MRPKHAECEPQQDFVEKWNEICLKMLSFPSMGVISQRKSIGDSKISRRIAYKTRAFGRQQCPGLENQHDQVENRSHVAICFGGPNTTPVVISQLDRT